MTTAFTPGPWHVEEEIDGYMHGRLTRVKDTDSKQIASTFNQTRAEQQHKPDVCEANARLIASAPDLLKAARQAYEMSPFHAGGCTSDDIADPEQITETRTGCDCYLGELKAAIDKAEGRES